MSRYPKDIDIRAVVVDTGSGAAFERLPGDALGLHLDYRLNATDGALRLLVILDADANFSGYCTALALRPGDVVCVRGRARAIPITNALPFPCALVSNPLALTLVSPARPGVRST